MPRNREEDYDIPEYGDSDKKADHGANRTNKMDGYTKNTTVMLIFAIMFAATIVLAIGAGFLTHFVSKGNSSSELSEGGSTYSTLNGATGLGAIYTRWGRNTCPNGTASIYKGYAAGSSYKVAGGMVDTLCLPEDPEYNSFYTGNQPSYIYGAEYEMESQGQSEVIFKKSLRDQDAPCVVCKATGRPMQMMIPARKSCFAGWSLEYHGYLMTSHTSHKRTDVVCVDNEPETVDAQSANSVGRLLYFVEANGQLPSPPYEKEKELTCAVCTQ